MKKSVLVLSLSSILLLASCGENKVPATFLVSFSSGEGYTINGEKEAKEGDAYSFRVSFNEGYEAGSSYAVKANGEEVKKERGRLYRSFRERRFAYYRRRRQQNRFFGGFHQNGFCDI